MIISSQNVLCHCWFIGLSKRQLLLYSLNLVLLLCLVLLKYTEPQEHGIGYTPTVESRSRLYVAELRVCLMVVVGLNYPNIELFELFNYLLSFLWFPLPVLFGFLFLLPFWKLLLPIISAWDDGLNLCSSSGHCGPDFYRLYDQNFHLVIVLPAHLRKPPYRLPFISVFRVNLMFLLNE